MNTTATGRSPLSEKVSQSYGDTCRRHLLLGDHMRIKRTQETGRINAADGGVVYVLMDETNGTTLFSAYVDEDAYIEFVTAEGEATLLQGKGMRREGA